MSGDESSEPLALEPIERLEDFKEDWDRLAPHAGHPFATWEWNSRWWEQFGAGRSLYCFAGRDRDGVVRAILPLYLAKTRPLKLARFLGYADLHSPLCEEADRPLAAQMLRSLTRRPHRCRLVLLERMPADEGWAELLGGRHLQSGPDPALHIDGRNWDEVLGSFSRNLRQQVRRRERRLVEEHGLSLRMAATAEELDGDLDTLFRLHAERWGEQTTGVFAGERAQFNRAFAADMLRRGWLRLWIAEVDGERAAAWYGWRFAGSDWYYQGRPRPSRRRSLGRPGPLRPHDPPGLRGRHRDLSNARRR